MDEVNIKLDCKHRLVQFSGSCFFQDSVWLYNLIAMLSQVKQENENKKQRGKELKRGKRKHMKTSIWNLLPIAFSARN